MAEHTQNQNRLKAVLQRFSAFQKNCTSNCIPKNTKRKNGITERVRGDDKMSIKKQSIKSLADGISKFEDSKNILKKSDFSDFKTFLKNYLNAPETKQRKKLAEEFRKRHLELYEFLKSNSDLISAETEISKTVNAVLCGDTSNSDDKQLTNLFEIIEGGMKK